MDASITIQRVRAAARETALIAKGAIKKTVDHQGIVVRVDRPAGFVQKGKDEAGHAWERTYKTDYGFIKGTQGGDGEGLDVYLGEDPKAPVAHWILQRKADGSFDEFKLMLGFADRRAAANMWKAHTPARFFGGVETTSVAMVKSLLGIDPQPVMKSEHVREQAFAILLKTAQRDDVPLLQKAQLWSVERGMLDSSSRAEVGRAVLRAAEGLAKSDGATALVGRALFVFLCDAWDTARTMATEDVDSDASSAMLLKAFVALAGAGPVSTRAHDGRLKKSASHETISRAVWGAIRAKLGVSNVATGVCENGPWMRDVFDDTAVYELGGQLFRVGYTFDGVAATITTAPELVVVQYAPAKPEAAGMEKCVARLVNAAAAPPSDEEERYVMGVVLEPDIADSQGHTYDAASVKQAAHRFMRDFRNIGLQHQQLVNDRIRLLESWVTPVKLTVGDQTVPPGTWLMAVRFDDDALWADVKAGKITGFSIGGKGNVEPVGAAG